MSNLTYKQLSSRLLTPAFPALSTTLSAVPTLEPVRRADLRKLGLEMQTGVAALLWSGKPGPTVAPRADVDALPVTERTDVPFRSTGWSNYRGEDAGIMHAGGHDSRWTA